MAQRSNVHDVLQARLTLARKQVASLEEAIAAYGNDQSGALPSFLLGEEGGDVSGQEEHKNTAFSIEPIPSNQSLLLDMLNIGTLQWNVEKRSVITSAAWNNWFGTVKYNAENPLKTLYACLDPRDLHFVTNQLKIFLAGDERCTRITLRVTNNGKIQWIEVAFIVQRSFNNEVVKLSCFAMDMTYFKEKEIFFKKELDILNDARIGFPSVSLLVNSEFTITDISPGAYHYTDINPENLKNIPLGIFFDPPSYARIQHEVAEVLRSKEPRKCKTDLTFYNNTTIPAVMQFWPEKNEPGKNDFAKNPSGKDEESVNILIWDTQSTHYLVENFYTLFSNLMDGFILVQSLSSRHSEGIDESEPFSVIVMNHALASMYGTNFRQYIGQDLKSLVGSDYEQWEICLQQVAVRNKPVVYCMKSKEKPILLEISAFPSGLDNIGCIVKDVTTMHAAEQAMHLNEARSSALYRLSYMYALPINAVLTYALSQMIQLTESETGMLAFYDVDSGHYELWSQGPSGVVVRKNIPLEELERIEGFHKVRLSGKVANPFIVNTVDEPFICSNGKQAVRYMIAPVVDEGKLVCLARVANKGNSYGEGDLRQLELFLGGAWLHLRRRWARDFLQKAKEQAEAANQAKDMFLANVSHELRTPLNGILGMLQLLQQSSLGEEQQEWVQVAADSGRGLMRIISDILDIARIEASHYEVVDSTFNFPASIQSTLSIFAHKASQLDIEFSTVLDANIPSALIGDEALLRQIILNLIGNAFKFTSSGSISFECSMLPIERDNTVNIYMAFHDTGIGIPEDKISTIYKAFTQLDSSLTRKYGGVGLGLSIVSRLVTVMNGSLCIDSVPGKGTSFYLSIPFKRGQASQLVCENPFTVSVFQHKLSILVAEDDAVNQFTIKTMLQKMGHSVLCVENGIEALKVLQSNSFDCVITDIQMPGMDGEELIERIRKGDMALSGADGSGEASPKSTGDGADADTFNRNIPIVALSAHAMAELEGHFVNTLGANYYLEKPINIHKLSKLLEKIGKAIKE